MANEKTTKISDLHPKDNKNVTIYPNTTSESIIDKVDTLDSSDKVPTSNAVKKNDDRIENKVNNNSDKLLTKLDKDTFDSFYTDEFTPLETKTENMNKVIPTDLKIVIDTDGTKKFALFHDSEQISGQVDNIGLGDGLDFVDNKLTYKFNYLYVYNKNDSRNFSYISESGINVTKGSNKYGFYTFVDTYTSINNISLSYSTGFALKRSTGNNLPLVQLFNTEYSTTSHSYGVTAFIGINSYGLYRDRHNNYFLGYCKDPETNTIDKYKGIKLNNIYDYNYDLPKKDGTFAMLSDVESRQSTLYRHTVKIFNATMKSNFAFTTESEKNLKIDSIQDLVSVFGNTTIAGCGILKDENESIIEVFNTIVIGLSINDTYLTQTIDFEMEPFTDIFGSSGFEINDIVTAM